MEADKNAQAKDTTPRWDIPMTGATGKSWLKKRAQSFFNKQSNQTTRAELEDDFCPK